MTDEVFADRFGDISITGSTIRIDLVSLSPVERDSNGQPVLRFRQRIVLPIEGFLSSHEMMQRMIDLLKQQGVIRPGEPAGSVTDPAGPRPPAPPAGSPNFPTLEHA